MGKLNTEAWERIDASEMVLQWIQCGVKLPFKENPPSINLNNHAKEKFRAFIDGEIKWLLQQKVIKRVNERPYCVLPINCVPKKSGKLRLVLDCRYIMSRIQIQAKSVYG